MNGALPPRAPCGRRRVSRPVQAAGAGSRVHRVASRSLQRRLRIELCDSESGQGLSNVPVPTPKPLVSDGDYTVTIFDAQVILSLSLSCSSLVSGLVSQGPSRGRLYSSRGEAVSERPVARVSSDPRLRPPLGRSPLALSTSPPLGRRLHVSSTRSSSTTSHPRHDPHSGASSTSPPRHLYITSTCCALGVRAG